MVIDNKKFYICWLIILIFSVNIVTVFYNYAQQDDLAYLSYYPKDNFWGTYVSHPQYIFTKLIGVPLHGFIGNKIFNNVNFIEDYKYIKLLTIFMQIFLIIFFYNHLEKKKFKNFYLFFALTLIILSPQFLILINWSITSLSLITFFLSYISGDLFYNGILNKNKNKILTSFILLIFSLNLSPTITNLFFCGIIINIFSSSNKKFIFKIFILSILYFSLNVILYYLSTRFLIENYYFKSENFLNVYNSLPERYKFNQEIYIFDLLNGFTNAILNKIIWFLDPYSINKKNLYTLPIIILFILFFIFNKNNKLNLIKFTFSIILLFPNFLPVFLSSSYEYNFRIFFSYVFSISFIILFMLQNIELEKKYNKYFNFVILIIVITLSFRSINYNFINSKMLSEEYSQIYESMLNLKYDEIKNLNLNNLENNMNFKSKGDGEFYHLNTNNLGSIRSIILEIFRKENYKKEILISTKCNYSSDVIYLSLNSNKKSCKVTNLKIENIF